MAYKKSFRSKARKGSKRTYKRKSYAPKRKMASIKKVVQREIARNVEDKVSQYYDNAAGLVAVTDATFGAVNIFPLGPNTAFAPIINQGTAQSSRIGNRIKTKKLVVKGSIYPLPYNVTTNPAPQPVLLKCWIMYDKTNPTAEPDPKGNADFFQLGGSTKSFANNLTDMWAPVNTDRYRVLTTRTYKLGYSDYSATPGTAVYINQQNFRNNDFPVSVNFSIDCTKYYPKDVRFNDNNALPTTRSLFMLWEYVAANGGPLSGQAVAMQYMQDYHFEDA